MFETHGVKTKHVATLWLWDHLSVWSPNTNRPTCVSAVSYWCMEWSSFLVIQFFEEKKLHVSHQHDDGMYVFVDRRLSDCSALFTRKKSILCRLYPSVCLFLSSITYQHYTDNLDRGAVRDASCGRSGRQRQMSRKMVVITEKWRI